MMARMTGERDQDQQYLEAALEDAVRGAREAADLILDRIASRSPERRFRLWQALAETAIHPLRHQPPGGPLYGLQAFTGHPDIDVTDAPPGFQLALRFVTAQAARDTDQMRALFLAAHDTGQHQVMTQAQALLVDAAVASARAQLADPVTPPAAGPRTLC